MVFFFPNAGVEASSPTRVVVAVAFDARFLETASFSRDGFAFEKATSRVDDGGVASSTAAARFLETAAGVALRAVAGAGVAVAGVAVAFSFSVFARGDRPTAPLFSLPFLGSESAFDVIEASPRRSPKRARRGSADGKAVGSAGAAKR